MSNADFVNSIYQAALAAGLTDAAARVTASQAAIESGYGAHAPGNNFFGIKAGPSWSGPVQTLRTKEVINGKTVKVKQPFRIYATPEEGIADRIKVMDRAFPGFSQAPTVGAAFDVLQNGRYGRYATASRSDYESALNHVNSRYLGGTPVPPMPVGSAAARAGVPFASVAAGRVPLPAPAPLVPPKPLAQMPKAAMYGQDRLTPGKVTLPPTDFATNTGAPDLRTLGMVAPPILPRGLPMAGGALPSIAQMGLAATGGAAGGVAPVPMPGRPPALNAAPPAPVQAQPPQLPAQRPSAPVAPPPVQLRLASGKTIAPGIYTQADGHSVQVSDAGDGTAKITKILGPGTIPGVINPLREMSAPTIAGDMIRKMLPTALAGNASAFVPTLTNNVKSAAANAAGNLGGALGGFGGGILGGLGGLFGQHQAPSLPRPFSLLGGALQQQAPPVPMNRPAALSVPQAQRAQNDLRNAGILDSFGMMRGVGP